MIDLHTHSKYSFDTEAEPAEITDMAQVAIRAGVDVLAVTDHYDLFREAPSIFCDVAAIQADIAAARPQFDGQVELLRGIELGQPQRNPSLAEEVLSNFSFDVVIGSLHVIPNDVDLYDHDYDHIDCDALLRDYFAEMVRMEQHGGFDILAHLDYPLRVMKRPHTNPSFDNFMEHILPVLREAVNRGYAIECNAATLFSWMQRPGPDRWILEEYRRLGGERISLGSDAHRARDIGRGFDVYVDYIRSLGFDHLTVFRNRQAQAYPI